MPYVTDNALDAQLNYIRNNATHLYVCSQLPATYAEATSAYALGNKATPTIGTPADHPTSGRRIQVATITDGSVTGTGTASHWALVNSATSELLAAGALNAAVAVASGRTLLVASFYVNAPNPA